MAQETQETQVRSPVGKDPLEEEMATHSNILAWRIPWRSLQLGDGARGAIVHRVAESDMT